MRLSGDDDHECSQPKGYAGLLTWTVAQAARAGLGGWRNSIVLHMLPVAFIAGDYIVDIRKLAYAAALHFRSAR
jgi:hypothetical protein